jgi:hypothetical protein
LQDSKPVITPPQVQQVFAHDRAPIVRYASAPELCDRRACSGLEYWGARQVVLAPAGKPDFEVVVFGTPKDAARVVALFRRPGQRVSAMRRGNAGLFALASSPRLAQLRATFAKIHA